MDKHVISKSTFIRGVQCTKSFYLNKHSPELKDEISESQEAIFARGKDVGKLAHDLFPGGIDASPESYYDFAPAIKKTSDAIESGEKVIYEAAFQHDGVLAAVDILVKKNGKWIACEVKSSTSVSDTHIMDTALQYYVMTNAGIKLSDIFVVYINNKYVRKGDVEPHKLFSMDSVLGDVKKNQSLVKEKIEELKRVLDGKTAPNIDIGVHCESPYPCDFQGSCWPEIKVESVFDVSRLNKKKKFELYHSGIVSLADLPKDIRLSDTQRIQVTSSVTNTEHIDKKGIQAFLRTLKYPLFFLDFESFMPVIPLYDKSRPYQHIVFQYSLHYKKSKAAEATNTGFLGDGKTDPRESLIKKLLEETEGAGDILVYNQSFEKTRLEELACDYPKYAEKINKLIGRIKDLLVPFQKKLYYRPEMRGSASIKAVLPALVPDMSYDGLEIANGGDAMREYESLFYEKDTARIESVRNALLKYCGQDTLAMVKILEVLESDVG